jgi:predicted nucleotidyltransferase
MLIPSDYKDLLRILNKHKVKYLMVGAYAVIYYTEPRYTKDLDIWIEPTIENAKRVYNALKEFGAPLKDITFEDFTNKNLFYQIGVAPVRVDIIMGISDLEFSKAWKSRKRANFEGIKVNIIGIDDLIKLKEKTKRDIDKVDVNILKLKLKLRREK